jgi:hypothetical protein
VANTLTAEEKAAKEAEAAQARIEKEAEATLAAEEKEAKASEKHVAQLASELGLKTEADADVQEALFDGKPLPTGTVYDPYGSLGQQSAAEYLEEVNLQHQAQLARSTALRARQRKATRAAMLQQAEAQSVGA